MFRLSMMVHPLYSPWNKSSEVATGYEVSAPNRSRSAKRGLELHLAELWDASG